MLLELVSYSILRAFFEN